MAMQVDIDIALLVGLAFAAGAVLKPLLLWFGLKALGKAVGPAGVVAGGLTAIVLVARVLLS